MSAAVAEPTNAPEPTIDDLFAEAAEQLTTRTSGLVPETATPEPAPVSEPKQEGEEASTDTPTPGRDANGRFAPKEGDAPEQEAAPAEAKQTEPDPREVIAALQRQLESTRGNVDN